MSLRITINNVLRKVVRNDITFLDRSYFPVSCNFFSNFADRKFIHHDDKTKLIQMAFTAYEKTTPVTDSNTAIVVLHGLFGSKMNWSYLGRAMHKELNRKVFLVDARNHGNSPHTEEHDYPLMVEDLKLFLEEHDLKKAALIGHSMGGRTVMLFALKYPELVDSLVVADISPIGTSQSLIDMVQIFEAMKALNFDDLKNEKNVYEARKKADQILCQLTKDKRISSFLVTNIVEKKPRGYDWRINLNGLSDNYIPHITKFSVPPDTKYAGPTLFITGSKSDYVNPKHHKDIRDLFPKAEFVELEAGHWVHADRPEEFLVAVCRFYNEMKK